MIPLRPTAPHPGTPPVARDWDLAEEMRRFEVSQRQQRTRSGISALAIAAVLHGISIPIGIFVLKVLVEYQSHSITWTEFFDAIRRSGAEGLIVFGLMGQLVFAVLAAAGAASFVRGYSSAAVPIAVVGVIGMVFSIAVFGGLVGLAGGALSVYGGMKARTRPTTPPPFFFQPPTYFPPPPEFPPP